MSDGKVEWLEETAKTADEVLGNVFAAVGRPNTQMQQAKDILSQLLADGPKAQREVIDRMALAGVSESTAKKAKALLAVRSVKQGAQWFWSLPCGADGAKKGCAGE